jgi:hypothetical protein
VPKSFDVRAEDMAREVMRRSDVTRASASVKGSVENRSVVSVREALVWRPAKTRLRPIESRSSSLV